MLRRLNKLLNYYPTRVGRSILLGLVRSASREFKAYSDIFYADYAQKRDWRSGLGDSHHLLYAVVRATRPEVIVEIGSARGKSTCTLALACRQNNFGKVYAIDPHTVNAWTDVGVGESSYEFLLARLLEYDLRDWCEVMPTTSQRAAEGWSRPIDLLFIDGDHTYEGVKLDFEAFQPWLKGKLLSCFMTRPGNILEATNTIVRIWGCLDSCVNCKIRPTIRSQLMPHPD